MFNDCLETRVRLTKLDKKRGRFAARPLVDERAFCRASDSLWSGRTPRRVPDHVERIMSVPEVAETPDLPEPVPSPDLPDPAPSPDPSPSPQPPPGTPDPGPSA
jgi:hypothetical protein